MSRATALTVVALAGLLLLAGCERGNDSGRQPSGPASPEQRTRLETFAGIKIPAGATEVEVDEAVGVDRSMLARFRISGDDLDRFVADAGMAKPPAPGVNALQPGAGKRLGWRIEEIREFRGYEETRPGFARQFLIDLDDPEHPVVYVHAFTV